MRYIRWRFIIITKSILIYYMYLRTNTLRTFVGNKCTPTENKLGNKIKNLKIIFLYYMFVLLQSYRIHIVA